MISFNERKLPGKAYLGPVYHFQRVRNRGNNHRLIASNQSATPCEKAATGSRDGRGKAASRQKTKKRYRRTIGYGTTPEEDPGSSQGKGADHAGS